MDKMQWNNMILPWGKTAPHKPLLFHLLDAGFIAQELLKSRAFKPLLNRLSQALGITKDQTLALCGFIVAVHDIGKCHPKFQGKADTEWVLLLREQGLIGNGTAFTHEHESSLIINKWISNTGHITSVRRIRRMLCAVLEQHHCRGLGAGNSGVIETEQQRLFWDPIRLEMIDFLVAEFGVANIHIEQCNQAVAGLLISGLTMFADWIASNSELINCKCQTTDYEEYITASREMALQAIQVLGFEPAMTFTNKQTFSAVWPEITSLRPMQACIEQLCSEGLDPGIAIIEAPMGEGKTEAAIYLAVNWMVNSERDGMYMALPTAATSNQMFYRMKGLLDSHNVDDITLRLVHGKVFLLDDQSSTNFQTETDNIAAANWFRPLKRAILSPYAVGTVDQVMYGALYVKHFPLRLFGLAGKILVIDEVHAYDAYMSTIIERLLQWCGAIGIPVILLSATLPLQRRAALAEAYLGGKIEQDLGTAYPAILLGDQQGNVKSIPFSSANQKKTVQYVLHNGMLGKAEAAAKLALHLTAEGGCLCVIANTVFSAQEIYRELKAMQGSAPCKILLFHARFTAGRRNGLENEVIKLFSKTGNRPKRAILVATQVVEQSLDIDFDLMISEIAPIDLLLQRAGRIHRHERGLRLHSPVMHILMPELNGEMGTSGLVYAPFILQQTAEVLQQTDCWTIPADLRPAIEAVYGDAAKSGQGYEDHVRDIQSMEVLAKQYLIPTPLVEHYAWQGVPPYEEGDENMAGLLHASTRQGIASVNLIVLEGLDMAEVLQAATCPARPDLLKLFQKAVSVPWYWLKDVLPCDGFKEIAEGPEWLKGYRLLHLMNGSWLGRKGSHIVQLINHEELGLCRIVKEGD